MPGFYHLCQHQALHSTGLTGPAEVKAQMQKLTRVGALPCGWLMNVVSVQAWLLLPRAVVSGVNIATIKLEDIALFESLSRALRLRDPNVLFEVDSLILAKQLTRRHLWACRSENLIPLHQQCVHVCDALTPLRISWDIRHIYREFNQTADALPNQANDERATNGPSQFR